MRNTYLPFLILLFSCHQETIIGKKNFHSYLNPNQFNFETTIHNASDSLLYNDYVILHTFGRQWNADLDQFSLAWELSNDIRQKHSGGLVRGDSVWIHPPRSYQFKILEGNAFPSVKYPYKKGKQWHGLIHTSISAWFTGYPKLIAGQPHDTFKVEHYYTFTGQGNYVTSIGTIHYKKITGIAKSQLGTTESWYQYSKSYGFISMKFQTLNSLTITMKLKAINGIKIDAYDPNS